MKAWKQLTLALLAFYFLLSPLTGVAENMIRMTPQQMTDLGIKLGKPEAAGQIPLFSAPAKVVVPPANEFVVSSSQAGLITKMNASIGDKVSKDGLLALISSPDLLTMQGNYLKAVSALKLAAATYKRDKTLLKEGVVSGRDEQTSYNAYRSAWVEANQARQLLHTAGMNTADIKKLDSTGQLASQITIRSPIGGRVLDRMAVTGAYVDNLAPLYRIADLTELWLEINIPQEHSRDIQPGDPVLVENGQARAVIKVLGESINAETQTIPARAILQNGQATLKVGQKVTVQVIKTDHVQAYKLPDNAIARHEGKAYIFIRQPEGFKVAEVEILGKQPGETVIAGGFSGEENIAVDNAALLKANWLGLGSGE